jgi:NAD(P)-dependent dehydrogenase (short-subunit alcohol dehydrogenase family)
MGRQWFSMVEIVLSTKHVQRKSARFGVSCTALACDAGQPVAIRDGYKSTFGAYERLDILVNNAGITQNSVLGMITDETIRATFDVNTIGVIHHIQEASRLMGRKKEREHRESHVRRRSGWRRRGFA